LAGNNKPLSLHPAKEKEVKRREKSGRKSSLKSKAAVKKKKKKLAKRFGEKIKTVTFATPIKTR